MDHSAVGSASHSVDSPVRTNGNGAVPCPLSSSGSTPGSSGRRRRFAFAGSTASSTGALALADRKPARIGVTASAPAAAPALGARSAGDRRMIGLVQSAVACAGDQHRARQACGARLVVLSISWPSRSTGARHSKASSVPVTGDTGAQCSETKPSATQAGSRGARTALDSYCRTLPWSPLSASSMSASSR